MRPFSSGESRVRFLKACFCELRGVTRGHGKSVRGQTRLGKAGLLPTCCGRPAGAAGDGVPGQRAAVALHLRICIRDFLFIYFFTCRECLFLKEFICTQLKTYPREPVSNTPSEDSCALPFIRWNGVRDIRKVTEGGESQVRVHPCRWGRRAGLQVGGRAAGGWGRGLLLESRRCANPDAQEPCGRLPYNLSLKQVSALGVTAHHALPR